LWANIHFGRSIVFRIPSGSTNQSEESHLRKTWNFSGCWIFVGILHGVLGTPSCTTAQTVAGSNFENGAIDPFKTEVCCGNSISAIKTPFPARSGSQAVELKWHQKNYQGNRISRGVEATTSERGKKETWYGFSFYLPGSSFPHNKSLIIAQQNAWEQRCQTDKTTVLYVTPDELGIHGYWGYSFDLKGRVGGALTKNIPRDRWVDVVIHTIFSRSNKGLLEVWYDGAPQGQPTLKLENINIGTGCWSGDTLTYGQYAKFGIYAWDTNNYTVGESRTIYFDNVSYLTAASSTGFNLVNPASANFRLMRLKHQQHLMRQQHLRKNQKDSFWKDRP
jgi:hypothetical protein